MEILSRLSDSSTHGYQLHKEVGVTASTIYAHLEELEEAGMIEQTDNDDERINYRITKNGEKLIELLK